MKVFTTWLLLVTVATAQFVAPQTTESSMTSPTRTTALTTGSTSVTPSASSTSSPAVSSIPAPPAESSGCVLHGDHYHCAGPASGVTPSGTKTTSVTPTTPSPTESSNCIWHETHWDCFTSAAEASSAASANDSGECVIHVGHTHGDCSAQDLACGAILLENYNMGLHVGAIFIILVTSALGVLIPMISGWRKNKDGEKLSSGDPIAFGRKAGFWASLFFLAKHFGTGIIIATAFIHLLFHGFVMFQNECVGHLVFESAAAAIAMAGAFVTFLLDFFGTRLATRRLANSAEVSQPDSPPSTADNEKGQPFSHDGCGHHVDAVFAAEQSWQVLLLEAGIIFHSIMIGVTLGAGSGSGWTTLLIVIVFHQFFEGAALGARIALLYWISRLRATIMGLAFIFITPIGIAIGIGVRQSFSQNGKSSLLSVGILNSISAGILLYTAFKLLNADFVDGPLRNAGMGKVVTALLAMVVGMIGMSVLGKWA